MCATRVVFKGTGTIWLRCHRSRRQDRENRTPRMLPLTVSGQPLEISLERLGQSMSLYVPLSKEPNIDGRGAAVPDAKAVIVTMRLPESDDGLRLIQSIIDTKANAESAMRVFQTGRPDALGKISMGIRSRAD